MIQTISIVEESKGKTIHLIFPLCVISGLIQSPEFTPQLLSPTFLSPELFGIPAFFMRIDAETILLRVK